jgi:hypothetical protein
MKMNTRVFLAAILMAVPAANAKQSLSTEITLEVSQ